MNIMVVIPIYNESKRIPDSIATLKKWCATIATSGYDSAGPGKISDWLSTGASGRHWWE